jgi:hypothetical protein
MLEREKEKERKRKKERGKKKMAKERDQFSRGERACAPSRYVAIQRRKRESNGQVEIENAPIGCSATQREGDLVERRMRTPWDVLQQRGKVASLLGKECV